MCVIPSSLTHRVPPVGRSWDIAQVVPVDRVSPSETFDSLVKGLRIFFYIFLFLLVLVSGAVSIVSFLGLESLARRHVTSDTVR